MSTLRGITSDHRRFIDRAILPAGSLAAVTLAGAMTAVNPTALAVACAATLAAILISSPSARFGIVVVGGLLVFRSSDQLDAPKLAYLVWVGAAAAVAIARLVAERQLRQIADIRPLALASAALAGVLGMSLVVALSYGTPFVDWIRDAAPYCLLAISPFLAWDGARSRLGSHMEVVAVVSGLAASVAFAVEWLGRRGLADLPLATLGSSSDALSALAFVVAIGAIVSGRPRRLLWAFVAAAVMTLLLITGTRSALILLAGPVGMALAHGRTPTRARRLGAAAITVGLAMVALAFVALQSGLIDGARLAERFGSLLALGANLSSDQSFVERSTQVGVASSAFTSSPMVGVGLGFRFESVRLGGEPFATFTIDTGLSIAAKFGLVGIGLLGIATVAIQTFFRRLRTRIPEHMRLSFVGFAAVSIAMLPLGNPFEDKGFGLALAILFAWALTSARAAPAPDSEVGVGANVIASGAAPASLAVVGTAVLSGGRSTRRGSNTNGSGPQPLAPTRSDSRMRTASRRAPP